MLINLNLHIEGDYICIRSDSNNDGNTGKPALYFSEDNYDSSIPTSYNNNGNVRIINDASVARKVSPKPIIYINTIFILFVCYIFFFLNNFIGNKVTS